MGKYCADAIYEWKVNQKEKKEISVCKLTILNLKKSEKSGKRKVCYKAWVKLGGA